MVSLEKELRTVTSTVPKENLSALKLDLLAKEVKGLDPADRQSLDYFDSQLHIVRRAYRQYAAPPTAGVWCVTTLD